MLPSPFHSLRLLFIFSLPSAQLAVQVRLCECVSARATLSPVHTRGTQGCVSGTPLTHNRSALPTSPRPPLQNKAPRQDKSGGEDYLSQRDAASHEQGEPKIAVITWSAADTHCDVCVCAWLCVYLCFFTRLVIAASHKREMDANHRSDIMIQAGRWNTPFASNISCLDIYLF